MSPYKYVPDRKEAKVLNKGRFERRLAPKIADDDCWIWNSTCQTRRNPTGKERRVPVFMIVVDGPDGRRTQKMVYARRWAFEQQFGPQKGISIVNVCGNDTCVRPDERHNRRMEQGTWLYHDVEDLTIPSSFAAIKEVENRRAEQLLPPGVTYHCTRCGENFTTRRCPKCGLT